MSDEDIHSQAYLYAVGALDPDQTHEFETHLAGCADCRAEVADMHEITARLSATVAGEPPAALRSSVLAAIADVAQEGSAAPSVVPSLGRHAARVGEQAVPAQAVRVAATAVPDARSSSSVPDNVVPLRRSWRERVPMLVAAAAVLALIGVGGWAVNARDDARDQAAQLQATNSQLTSVLSSPDVQTVSAKTSDGGLAGVVRSQSRGVALLVSSGLPSLPSDKTYQAWTIDADGVATSAGTFESQSGQTVYALPAAAVTTGTVAVSVERAGGATSPSTPIVALSLA